MDFNHDGTWSESQQGPAIHAPDNVKNIIVEKYRIEWLNISDPKENFYAKNHMVATLVFSEGVIINNLNYFSARWTGLVRRSDRTSCARVMMIV